MLKSNCFRGEIVSKKVIFLWKIVYLTGFNMLKLFSMKTVGWTIKTILNPKKERIITIIAKKGEQILLVFLGRFYISTGLTLKFNQKSNFSHKNNLFSTFSGKCIGKKILKIITFG